MFRTPLSRISLTGFDVSGLDERIAERRWEHARNTDRARFRVGRVSSGSASQGFVSADNNHGPRQAATCSSEPIVYIEEDHADMTPIADQHQPSPASDTTARPEKCHSQNSSSDEPAVGDSINPNTGPYMKLPGAENIPIAFRTSLAATQSVGIPDVSEICAQKQTREAGRLSISKPHSALLRGSATSHRNAWVYERLPDSANEEGTLKEPSFFVSTAATERNGISNLHAKGLERATSRNGRSVSSRRTRHKSSATEVAMSSSMPNIDRYPPMRPSRPRMAPRRSSGSQRSVIFPRRRSSHRHRGSIKNHQYFDPPISLNRQHKRRRTPYHRQSTVFGQSLEVPLPTSRNSHSTPDLFHAIKHPPEYPHSSSFGTCSPVLSESELPEILGLASNEKTCTISQDTLPRQGSLASRGVANGDIIALLRRDSPLDELIEVFNRLASVHHKSSERVDESLQSRGDSASPLSNFQVPTSRSSTYRLKVEDDRVALSEALTAAESPLSTNHADVLELPYIPRMQSQNTCIEDNRPSAGADIKELGFKPANATPKVSVYKDDASPGTQPQTPADIAGSPMVFHSRYGNANARPHTMASPTQLRSEQQTHRHTYPAPLSTPSSTPWETFANMLPQTQTRRQASIRIDIGHTHRVINENSTEVDLREVEEDRVTWIGRREDGSLESTPPREGRFEQYLS